MTRAESLRRWLWHVYPWWLALAGVLVALHLGDVSPLSCWLNTAPAWVPALWALPRVALVVAEARRA